MKYLRSYPLVAFVVFTILIVFAGGIACAENIDPANNNSQYTYGENVGWLNGEPNTGLGVHVSDNKLTGYIWGENIGWIHLNPSGYGGVSNNGKGSLSGYAWAENVGWINFAPTHGGVVIDADTGLFSGDAWGENIGWVRFASTHHSMTTSWEEFPWILFYPAFMGNR